MMSPEITPYGDSPLPDAPTYAGVLYRYKGAEHIGIELQPDCTNIYFSTNAEAYSVAAAYERYFGLEAKVELEPEDEPPLDDVDHKLITAEISLGPRGVLVVRNDSLILGWTEPHEPFYDRTDETSVVSMVQTGQNNVDFRHKELIVELATPAVRADLARTIGGLII